MKDYKTIIKFFDFLRLKKGINKPLPIEVINFKILNGMFTPGEEIYIKPHETLVFTGIHNSKRIQNLISLPKISIEGNSKIYLENIPNIKIISNLKAKVIDFFQCTNLHSVSNLKCKILKLDSLQNLTTIDFIEANSINIYDCNNIKSIGENIIADKILVDDKYNDLFPSKLRSKIVNFYKP